jgi:PAS domain S-box-containing protein
MELISRYLPDTTLTFVNEANCRAMGLSREQLVGTKFMDLLPDSEREPIRARIRLLLEHPGVSTMEHQVRMADGSLRWQQWVDRTILDETGQVIELQGVGRDVTERKQMEHALHESEARYRATFDSAAIGVAIVDLAGCPLEVNEYICQMVGYTVDELRTMALRDFTHPDDVAENEALLRGALDGDIDSYQVEKRYLHKDGHIVWGRVSASLVHSRDGTPVYFVVHLEDITPRKQLEQERAEQAEQLDRIVESMGEGLFVYDTQGETLRTNAAARRLLGLETAPPDFSQLSGQERISLYAPHERQDGQMLTPQEWLAARALAGGGDVMSTAETRDVCLRTLDGRELEVSASVAPLHNPAGQIMGAVLLLNDRTERNQLVREREEARASELALAETKSQMDMFLGIASHELKTPLTSLKLSLQSSQRHLRKLTQGANGGGPDGSPGLRSAAEQVGRTAHQVERIEALVNDLVDVSRIQAGKLELHPEPVDLVAVVNDAVVAQQEAAPERRIDLQHSGERSVPAVVDAGRIEQVVTNYLTNALKYSPVDRPVEVGFEVETEHVRVWVRDYGEGVPLTEQEHIWERFHRAQGVEVQSGTGVGLGLGLYISRMIVERHQGQVGVQSTPGQGASFWFTLPFSRPREEQI